MYGKVDESNSKDIRRGSISDINTFTENSNYPSFLINTSHLLSFKQKISNITWEKDGINLLQKEYFTEEDIQKYKMLIYKGCIPENLKGEFWFISSGAKKEMIEHPNYYNYLLNYYPNEIILQNKHQIEIDLNRTFPEDKFFHEEETINKLRNILMTYSKRNVSIGYVQGFNFIVGRILKFISNEEKVFWLFSQIIENILPIDFYSEMSGIMADVDILLCMIKEKYNPDLINYLREDFMIYIKNILMQWFLSLFILNFPIEAQLFVWDILLVDKSIVLFKTAIYLIKELKNDIFKVNNLEQLTILIKDYFSDFKNLNALKYNLILKKYEFNNSFINFNRLFILSEMTEKINQTNRFKLENLKEKISERDEPCDLNWPYCLYDYETYYKIIDHIVLRNNENLEIMDNYCENQSKKINNISDNNIVNNVCDEDLNFNNVLIERKKHFCENKKKIKEKDKNSEDSKNSTETEKSMNEKENNENYEDKKKRYKKIRNEKCISSLTFIKTKKRKLRRTETISLNSYQYFLKKLNENYQQVSLANNYILKEYDFSNQRRQSTIYK